MCLLNCKLLCTDHRRRYPRATAQMHTILWLNGERKYVRTDPSLRKDPNTRPTYAQLLKHPFLLPDKEADVDMVGWVASALEKRAARPVIPLKEVEA